MSNDDLSARTLFWRYAAACIDIRQQTGGITVDEYQRAHQHVHDRTTPTLAELQQWFPRPFAWFRDNGKDFELRTVKYYWHVQHRSAQENTPVRTATIVCHTKDPKLWDACIMLPRQSVEKRAVINLHNLNLTPGARVTVHAYVVAEILD